MSGFYAKGENFDRLFMTQHQFADRFLGNQLFGWGFNNRGQVGDNSTVNRSSPTDLMAAAKSNNWKKVEMGANTTDARLGLKTDGTLWSWGFNGAGGIGDNTTVNKSSPVTVIGGITWIDIARSLGVSCAISSSGILYAWGSNSTGEIGDNTTVNKSSPVTVVGTNSDWIKVFAGYDHVIALKSDNSLWAWGANSGGALGVGDTINRSSPTSISAGWQTVAGGQNYNLAIKIDGTLWSWGGNNSGQLGNNSVTARSSPGTVVGGGTWKSVAAGQGKSGAIKTDGTLWVWGEGSNGLGDNSAISKSSPVSISGGGTTWKMVTSDSQGSFCSAIKTDGTLWTWGSNSSGQLGDGTTINKSSPVTVAGAIQDWIWVSKCVALANI